ncbi:MAG: hypothetical protein JO179_02375 [Solirubrobacterales bacterium]|nr:hypothetical protein [Solirubrobacterales bacterium]
MRDRAAAARQPAAAGLTDSPLADQSRPPNAGLDQQRGEEARLGAQTKPRPDRYQRGERAYQ